jgi:hypothetical protein
METIRIKELKTDDSFRTKLGERIYTIVDVVYSEKLGNSVWLLKGGGYVDDPDREVVKFTND